MKVLIMGLRAAGKTSLVKHVFEGKEWDDVKNLEPTEFVSTKTYKYRGLLEVTTFDAGGQKQFIYKYFTDQWSGKIFSNVEAFFFVVDSSNKEALDEAEQEYRKALEYLKKYSPNAKIFVLASKYDVKKVSIEEIRKKFGNSNVLVELISIPEGTARPVVCKLLDSVLSKEAIKTAEKIHKILAKFNKKQKALASFVLNKADGLEIASAIGKELINPKKLKYVSAKSLIEPIDMAKKMFEKLRKSGYITFDRADLAIWHIAKEYVAVYNVSDEIAMFLILKERNFKLGSLLSSLQEVKKKILEAIS
ncbi:MAG: ADP-ribosylation factor-like protein [Candidatus Baldrarchaeia archaeon]